MAEYAVVKKTQLD